jgi:GDPmannose 4,6-dehydratase
MLQQERPDDFVIATGVQYSVRQFVEFACKELGIEVRWEGEGVDEKGIVTAVNNEDVKVKVGDTLVKVDPRYFRPTEVETLLGDPSKAREKLGWTPKTSLPELVQEMVQSDYATAKRDALVKLAGFQAYDYHE